MYSNSDDNHFYFSVPALGIFSATVPVTATGLPLQRTAAATLLWRLPTLQLLLLLLLLLLPKNAPVTLLDAATVITGAT